ncbi:MAG: SPOR domain-containing protein, partial [Pseudomonadota bacterium]
NTAGGVQYRLPTASLPTTALATSQTQPSAPVTRPVTAAPAPKATPPKATPASDSAAANSGIATGPKPPFAVQIASQRTVDAANRSYRTLSRRYASVLGGKGKDIRPIEIDGRGTFYRVRIPAQTRAEANALCRRLKSAGGDCFVTR